MIKIIEIIKLHSVNIIGFFLLNNFMILNSINLSV